MHVVNVFRLGKHRIAGAMLPRPDLPRLVVLGAGCLPKGTGAAPHAGWSCCSAASFLGRGLAVAKSR